MSPSLRPEHLLAAILSSAKDGLLSFGLDGNVYAWSKGAECLYGYTEAEITGHPLAQLIPVHEVPYYEQLLVGLQNGTPVPCQARDRLHKSGSSIRVELTHAVVQNETGGIAAVVESGRQVLTRPTVSLSNSVSVGRARLLRSRYQRRKDVVLRYLLEQMPAFVWTTDSNLRITSNWGSGMESANIKPGELVGRTAYEVLKCQDAHATTLSQYAIALQGTPCRFEFKLQNRDFEIRLEPLRDANGDILGCIGAGIDITERKRGEEEFRYQATHDALTGLANYRKFLHALEWEVRRAERAKHSFAVLLLDLDDLKRVNDRWGHLAGNRALRRLAEVLKEHCRSTDLAARYGGDEFAVLLIDADLSMARQIARRVENALDKDREEPTLSVCIGISVYPDSGRTARALLQAADRQLYKRKKGLRSVSAR